MISIAYAPLHFPGSALHSYRTEAVMSVGLGSIQMSGTGSGLHEHGRGQTLHWCLESYSVTPQSKGISTFSLLCVQTLILRKSTSNTIGFYSVPFELFKSGVTTLVLQSLAPTCLNTPALKFQVYQARPWLAGSGVWLGLELNSAGHRPSRNKFGDPWFKSISCLFYSFWMFLKLDITLKSIHVMQCSMNWA